MRKTFFVLAALLLLAATFVAAQEEITVPTTDTATGDLLVETEEPALVIVRKPITRFHLVGTGLAISEADAFDFSSLRVVIGAVKVTATADDNTDEEYVAKRLGVMKLDGATYHLKDIAVSGEEISAAIYGPTTTASAESIGEIKVALFEKPGRAVWAGNMVLNGKAYNVYLLGVPKKFRLAEVTEKIGEECGENSDDSKCRGIVARCGEDPVQCREQATAYCLNNPTDLGCLQLKKQYCLKNAADERCREYLKNLCEKNSTQSHCRITTKNSENVIGINSDAVAPVTAESGETVRNLITSKIRERLNTVKNSIDQVTNQARTGRA